MLKEPDGLLCGFIWFGSSTLWSLGSSRKGNPRVSLSISNSCSWSWQEFEACSWIKERVLLDNIVASSDVLLWVGYVYGSKKCYCITGVISPLRAYSIIWVSQSIGQINCQCYWMYFNLIAWLSLISFLRWWAQESLIVIWNNFI